MSLFPRQHQQSNTTEATRLALESAITAATALAQLVGDGDACDRLLMLKVDLIKRRQRQEHRGVCADASPTRRGPHLFTPTAIN